MTRKAVILLIHSSVATLSRAFGAEADKLIALVSTTRQTAPMNEALAIGNGRMGALVFGAPDSERISINESSLWTGDENPGGNYDKMGAYQVFGNVLVHLQNQETATNYRRDLDLGQALAHVHYECDGVAFEREFFCSHPAGVLVARFTASKSGKCSGSIQMNDSHNAKTLVTPANRMTVSGHLGQRLEV